MEKKTKKKKKSNAGRPTDFKEEVVTKLVEAFKNDFTDTEACIYAGISRNTFYRWLNEKPEFNDKIQSAKAFLFFAAKRNITQQVVNLKSVPDSWKFLEKRQKDIYADRQERTGAGGKPIQVEISNEEIEAYLKALKKADPKLFETLIKIREEIEENKKNL